MNDATYLRRLARRLRRLEPDAREEILAELRSAAESSKQSLEQRFGPVSALAEQYLAAGPLRRDPFSPLRWLWRWLLLPAAALLGLALLAMAVLAWWFSRDAFDYANPPAAVFDERPWRSVAAEPPVTVNAAQARLVLYWHDAADILINCKRGERVESSTERPATAVYIERDDCLLRLPQAVRAVSAKQANLVLVEPPDGLTVDLMQAKVRVAATEGRVLTLDATLCSLEPSLEPTSATAPGAPTLIVTGSMCQVAPY